jgi:cytochrome c-type biogenesis protein CcmH
MSRAPGGRRLCAARVLVAWAAALATPALLAQGTATGPGGAPAGRTVPQASPQASPLAADPALEERVLKIAEQLRCLVCQNETIAASRADLAIDLRNQVRDQLRAGRSEREIRDYMVARYGDFVLYTPPLKPSTWLLWGGPFALLGVTAGALGFLAMRRRRQGTGAAPLSEAEHERARALLAGDGGVANVAAAATTAPMPKARAEQGASASPSR